MNNLKELDYYINKFGEIEKYKLLSKFDIKRITYTYNTIKNNENNDENIDYENLNVNCINCINCYCCDNCNDCNNTIFSTDCKKCNDCNRSIRCINCIDCKNCIDCNHCNKCNICTDCNECNECNNCINCNNCLECKRYDDDEFFENIKNYCHNTEYIHTLPKMKFECKKLNPFLANLSKLYKGYRNENLDIIDDNDIVINIEDFENFNKIDNIRKLDDLINIIIKSHNLNFNKNFISIMIYNINYLQLKECIEILTKNNIIKV